MVSKSIIGLMPIEMSNRAEELSKMAGLKHKIDGFKIMDGLFSQKILDLKLIRLPKSKEKIIQIDVRHILKL